MVVPAALVLGKPASVCVCRSAAGSPLLLHARACTLDRVALAVEGGGGVPLVPSMQPESEAEEAVCSGAARPQRPSSLSCPVVVVLGRLLPDLEAAPSAESASFRRLPASGAEEPVSVAIGAPPPSARIHVVTPLCAACN